MAGRRKQKSLINISVVNMPHEERKKRIDEMQKKRIMFSNELIGKVIIYNEDIRNDKNEVDFILYYIAIDEDIMDSETIIYVDSYNERKKREEAKKEFERKRRRVV